MNVRDLKVGDLVFIKENLEHGKRYSGYIFVDGMCSGVQRIKSISKDFESFKVFDTLECFYTSGMVDWRKTFRLRVKEDPEEAHSEQGQEQEQDKVNSPSHYKLDGLDVESVDVIKSVLGKEKFTGWVWGNSLKYLLRQEKKNGLEDIKKAMKNLEWLIDALEEGKNGN